MGTYGIEKPVLGQRGHSIVPAKGRYVEQEKFTFLADQPELSQNMFLPLLHPLDAVHQLELHVRLLLLGQSSRSKKLSRLFLCHFWTKIRSDNCFEIVLTYRMA